MLRIRSLGKIIIICCIFVVANNQCVTLHKNGNQQQPKQQHKVKFTLFFFLPIFCVCCYYFIFINKYSAPLFCVYIILLLLSATTMMWREKEMMMVYFSLLTSLSPPLNTNSKIQAYNLPTHAIACGWLCLHAWLCVCVYAEQVRYIEKGVPCLQFSIAPATLVCYYYVFQIHCKAGKKALARMHDVVWL